jgi:putative membrane protein insertion efficiency factor
MKFLLVLIIRIYQRFFSFDTGILQLLFPGQTCRFTPRCSEYAVLAVIRYGTIVGLGMAIRRVLKCHPGNPGGFDPIP